MARFHVGGVDTFNALVYPDPHPGTMRFLENMAYQTTETLTDAGRAFMDTARQAYEQFSGSTAMRKLRAAGRHIAGLWQRDTIRPLHTVEELQMAPPKMQRWLMAEPSIRALYHKQQAAGYDETYHDAHPGQIGEDHYDYRRVMDGIVVETEEGWYCTQYLDELEENDVELLPDQQFDILHSWSVMAAAVAVGGQDPSSRWNAEL